MKKVNDLWTQISSDQKLSAEDQVNQRLNWIKAIRTFITRFDYEHIKEEDHTRYNRNPKEADKDEVTVEVTLHPDNRVQTVIVN
jgi:hypothetical protein